MAISVGEALQKALESSGWNKRLLEIQIKKEWPQIAGKTIAKYTKSIQLREYNLIITTDVAALKQELQYNKESIIQKINDHLKQEVVRQITIY